MRVKRELKSATQTQGDPMLPGSMAGVWRWALTLGLSRLVNLDLSQVWLIDCP